MHNFIELQRSSILASWVSRLKFQNVEHGKMSAGFTFTSDVPASEVLQPSPAFSIVPLTDKNRYRLTFQAVMHEPSVLSVSVLERLQKLEKRPLYSRPRFIVVGSVIAVEKGTYDRHNDIGDILEFDNYVQVFRRSLGADHPLAASFDHYNIFQWTKPVLACPRTGHTEPQVIAAVEHVRTVEGIDGTVSALENSKSPFIVKFTGLTADAARLVERGMHVRITGVPGEYAVQPIHLAADRDDNLRVLTPSWPMRQAPDAIVFIREHLGGPGPRSMESKFRVIDTESPGANAALRNYWSLAGWKTSPEHVLIHPELKHPPGWADLMNQGFAGTLSEWSSLGVTAKRREVNRERNPNVADRWPAMEVAQRDYDRFRDILRAHGHYPEGFHHVRSVGPYLKPRIFIAFWRGAMRALALAVGKMLANGPEMPTVESYALAVGNSLWVPNYSHILREIPVLGERFGLTIELAPAEQQSQWVEFTVGHKNAPSVGAGLETLVALVQAGAPSELWVRCAQVLANPSPEVNALEEVARATQVFEALLPPHSPTSL